MTVKDKLKIALGVTIVAGVIVSFIAWKDDLSSFVSDNKSYTITSMTHPRRGVLNLSTQPSKTFKIDADDGEQMWFAEIRGTVKVTAIVNGKVRVPFVLGPDSPLTQTLDGPVYSLSFQLKEGRAKIVYWIWKGDEPPDNWREIVLRENET